MKAPEHAIDRLLTEAHATAGPTIEQRLRCLRRLEAEVDAPPLAALGDAARPPLAPDPVPAAPVAAKPLVASGSKGLLWAVALGVLGIGLGYLLGERSAATAQGPAATLLSPGNAAPPTPTPNATPMQGPSEANPVDTAPVEATEPTREEPVPTKPRAAPPGPGRTRPNMARAADQATPERGSSPPDLHEALLLLRRAQTALREQQPSAALGALDELDTRVPADVLTEERQVTRVLAWCADGRAERARELAREISAAHPGSVYVERLAKSCASSLPPETLLDEMRRRGPN